MTDILLVEDEPYLVLGLSDAFSFHGFQVTAASTLREAQEQLAAETPKLCIVDLMLPDGSGYAFCEHLRKRAPLVPILILSALSQEADKLQGFAVGADDYVTKPFSLAELVARVQALLRRSQPKTQELLRIGDTEIDEKALVLRRNGESFVLTAQELQVLQFLYTHVGEAVSRDQILDAVWGLDAYPTPRTIDNFIVRLRKKIEDDPANPKHILTIYGLGYKLIR